MAADLAAYDGEEQQLGNENQDYEEEEFQEEEFRPEEVCGWMYKRKPRSTDKDKGGLKRMAAQLIMGSGRDAYDRRWLQFNIHDDPPTLAYFKLEPRDPSARPNGTILLSDILRVAEGAPTVDSGNRQQEPTPTRFPFRVQTAARRDFVFCADSKELRTEWMAAIGLLARQFRPVDALAIFKPSTIKSKKGMYNTSKRRGSQRSDEIADIPWASDIGNKDHGWKPKSAKEDQISSVANAWLKATSTRRPLRFLHGVESNGVVGIVLYQVTVQEKTRDEDGEIEYQKDMIHIVSGVNPGAALDAGIRPLDILLEVHGEPVTNRPMSDIAQLLCEASANNHGSFSITIGQVLDVTEENPNDIMEGWGQYADEHGRHYYYNTVSGESAWEPPVTSLPPHWNRRFDTATGTFYFINMQNGQRQAHPPLAPTAANPRHALDFHRPVVTAGWLHKRRDEASAWRVRWVTVLRSGQVTWSKSMGDNIIGSASLVDVDFELGMTTDGTDTGLGLWSLRLILSVPDKKGHHQILFGTEHRDVCDSFLEAMKFASQVVGPSDHKLTDLYGGAEEDIQPHEDMFAYGSPQHPDAAAIVPGVGPNESFLGENPPATPSRASHVHEEGSAAGADLHDGASPSYGAELAVSGHEQHLGAAQASTPDIAVGSPAAAISPAGSNQSPAGGQLSLSLGSIQLDGVGSDDVPHDAEIAVQGWLVRLMNLPGMERKQYAILQGSMFRVFTSDQDAAFFVATGEGPMTEIKCGGGFKHKAVNGKGQVHITSCVNGKTSKYRVDDVEEYLQWVQALDKVAPLPINGDAAQSPAGNVPGAGGGGSAIEAPINVEGAVGEAQREEAAPASDLALWNMQGDGV